MMILYSFTITCIAYWVATWVNKRFPKIPVIILSMVFVLILLWLLKLPYDTYAANTEDLFGHLLGYVTVALAVPLATMRYDDLALKPLTAILAFASFTAVTLPMLLAYLFQLSESTILSFSTRSVTTPIALNIANLIHAPVSTVSLVVVLSGLIGGGLSSLVLRKIDDDRAVGLALGLAAHAIGTVQAWQRSPVAGRYAAFGMAMNGVITAIWLPIVLYIIR